jgi:hypothetical protein
MSQTLPPLPAPASADAASPRRRIVIVMIVITIALFAIMMALLYRDWVRYREPASAIIVSGTPQFNGATITVEGTDNTRSYSATFGELDRLDCPFYLEPGKYRVKIKFGDRVSTSDEIPLAAGEVKKVNIFLPESTTVSLTTRPLVP